MYICIWYKFEMINFDCDHDKDLRGWSSVRDFLGPFLQLILSPTLPYVRANRTILVIVYDVCVHVVFENISTNISRIFPSDHSTHFLINLRAVNSYRSLFLERRGSSIIRSWRRSRSSHPDEIKHANRTGPAQLVAGLDGCGIKSKFNS